MNSDPKSTELQPESLTSKPESTEFQNRIHHLKPEIHWIPLQSPLNSIFHHNALKTERVGSTFEMNALSPESTGFQNGIH